MSDWLNEKYNQFGSIADALAANPVVFSAIMLGGGLLIWIKWSLLGKAIQRAAKGAIAGWSKQGEVAWRGDQVLVMVPANKPIRGGVLGVLFFGGGALFLWLVPLQEPVVEMKLLYSFGGLMCLAALSIFAILQGFARLYISATNITYRHPLKRTKTYALMELVDVEPVAKIWVRGVRLIFSDGQRLRIMANMSGYCQMLERLAPRSPKLNLVLRILGPKI